MKEENNISNHSNECISSDILLKYIKGELSGLERNRIERHLSSCEICSDELEGLSTMKNPEMIDEISLELNQRIDSFTAKPEREMPYFGMYIQIAASIIFILGVSTVIYFTAFRKTTEIAPSYALMETMDIAPPTPPMDSNTDNALNSNKSESKMENLELAVNRETIGSRGVEKENVKSDEALKYVAPMVVDSIVSDEAVVELKDEEVDNAIVDEFNVAEVRQVAAESIARAVPASAEKKSEFSLGGIAKSKLAASADKSNEPMTGTNYNTKKELAIREFTKSKYQEALAVFNELYNDYHRNDTILYYSSMCYYHLKHFNESIIGIEVLAKSPKSVFYNQAKWYYALSLIGAERKEEAKVILKQIVNDETIYKGKAKRELDKLK